MATISADGVKSDSSYAKITIMPPKKEKQNADYRNLDQRANIG